MKHKNRFVEEITDYEQAKIDVRKGQLDLTKQSIIHSMLVSKGPPCGN
jgi:hypothetical protein